MELYHLRTFVAVAEEGNLTRASERLFTSQPAVSAHIKALEEALGVALFDRTPKGMRLTSIGEDLLPRARHTLAAAGAFVEHARSLSGEIAGSVRIGLNSDARFLRVAALQTGLAARHPHLDVSMLGGSTGLNLPALRAGRLDASFISGERDDSDLVLHRLCDEHLVVAAPRAKRLRASGLEMSALARLPWIFTSPECAYYKAMQGIFQAHGCEPLRTLMADQEDAVLELVRAGAGLGIVRAGLIDGDNDRACELPVAVPPVPLQFAYLRARAGDAVIGALVAVLREVWGLDGAAAPVPAIRVVAG
ncbi:LysR family transcriptional regulator [Pseudothauera lacus]|uniref:LysR family transcriptional regulator n=1 Tax=Pseudothauera lacus TaxID=2136175 RepID=A0A2T4IBR8_9RHOO|nr:LysR family transcriptional regulator [Pseudothauera lacus]PTD95178.1 LysR family transcriptional regulator [Pseudothauera lacus]